MKTRGGERIDEVLLCGKVALGRGVAHAQFAAQFAQRQLLDAAGFQRGFGGAQKFLFRKQSLTTSNFQDTTNPQPYTRKLSDLLLYGSSSAMGRSST